MTEPAPRYPGRPQPPAPPYGGPPYGGPPYAGPPYAGPPYLGPPQTGYHAPLPGRYGPPPGYPPGYPMLPPPGLAPGGQPLASFGDRLLARLIDGGIVGVVAIALFVAAYPIAFARLDTVQVDDNGQITNLGPFLATFLLVYFGAIVLVLLGTYLYEVELMHRTGQTVGKRVMKLRIIPVEPGRQLTRGAAAKRWATYQLLGTVVPLFSWLDGLWQLWDKPYQQCLHDKAASTVVVKLTP